MSLGLCCQWLEGREKRDGSIVYKNAIEEKNLQLGAFKSGKYTENRIVETYKNNVDELIRLVPRLKAANIKSFRMSSSVLPLFEFCKTLATENAEIVGKFARLGGLFRENGIRVTCHPGQFTVISSDSDTVIQNSIGEVLYHAWMFDAMGLERSAYSAINIHGGKKGNSDRAIASILGLPDNVRSRLTLENDESGYSVADLVQISTKTGVPVVFDSHHHVFNSGGLSMEAAYAAAMATWGGIKPLQHISNTEIGQEEGNFADRRKHSYNIHYVPNVQLAGMRSDEIDVDVEAKGKNLALIKMREGFDIKV